MTLYKLCQRHCQRESNNWSFSRLVQSHWQRIPFDKLTMLCQLLSYEYTRGEPNKKNRKKMTIHCLKNLHNCAKKDKSSFSKTLLTEQTNFGFSQKCNDILHPKITSLYVHCTSNYCNLYIYSTSNEILPRTNNHPFLYLKLETSQILMRLCYRENGGCLKA